MVAARRRVLVVFVDGVGLGIDDDTVNAMASHMPCTTSLLGAPPVALTAPITGPAAALFAADATLGIGGIPQSGTGQASLLTGINAVELHGRHFGPWVPTRLRALVRTRSILARARDNGCTVAFANAYPEEVMDGGSAGSRMPPFLRAGPPLAALGAGVLDRHTAELQQGLAVASEIVNDGWRERLGRTSLPDVDVAAAARNLARIAADHDLTLFAHYSTDYAGHLRELGPARRAVERFDAFLGALSSALSGDTLLVVASDHGNVEDCTTGHTRNPALCLFAGAGFDDLPSEPSRLTDIAPIVYHVLKA